MKFSSALATTALVLSASAVAAETQTIVANDDVNSDRRAAVLEHYKGKTDKILSHDAVMDETTLERLRAVPVEGSETVLQYIPVPGTAGRRKLQVTRASATIKAPYPTGVIVTQPDQALTFVEDLDALTDISAFYIQGAGETMTITEGITIDTEDKTAKIRIFMGSMALGEYTWWAQNAAGEKTSTQSFEIVTQPVTKTIVRNSGSTPSNTVVGDESWSYGGQAQGAVGRIYYSSNGVDYACSGTVIKDNKTGRSLILTAAHCVWDDIDELWGSNVLFIPNRDATTSALNGDEIHRQCSEDICGCWTLSAGFVHQEWKDNGWPDRLKWDYGVYVVDDIGSHEGTVCTSEALDVAVDEMEFEVGVNAESQFLTGMGYSLAHNPDFRYCADSAGLNQPTEGVDTLWLPNCGLTGGASGGPWIMDMNQSTGVGKVVSVNSWSYAGESGMGGPIIDASGARCLVNYARNADYDAIEAREPGEEGDFVSCFNRDCITATELSERRLRGYLIDPKNRKLCSEVKH